MVQSQGRVFAGPQFRPVELPQDGGLVVEELGLVEGGVFVR